MKVLLISANTEKINMLILPLGLGCVAAAARKTGHEVKIVDLMTAKDTFSVIREALTGFDPSCIGIAVRNIDDQRMENTQFLLDEVKGVVADCRRLSLAPIVLGGAGYSIFPEGGLAYLGADMGIQGEGEMAMPALLDRIEEGVGLSGIPGLYLPRSGIQAERRFERDLDALPLPDDHVWCSSDSRPSEIWMPVQTRRGCHMNCNYCSTATIEGTALRRRSPKLVVEWISHYVSAGFQRFHFVDNTFNIPASYAREICRALVAHGLEISWRCILYPWRIDKALVNDMARSGCNEVSLGFESGCDRILRIMNKRFTAEEVRLTSRLLADHGIQQIGFLLLGGPGETRESVEESLIYADSLPLDMVKISAGIRIYPNTALARTSIQEGIITPVDNLLLPRFYLARGLEDWLHDTVHRWIAERPHWMI